MRGGGNQKVFFDAVAGAVLSSVTCTNLQENETSPEQGTSPAHFHFQQLPFFLDAHGGTSKTFIVNAIHNFLEWKEKNVIAVTTSAVAAQLFRNGRTA